MARTWKCAGRHLGYECQDVLLGWRCSRRKFARDGRRYGADRHNEWRIIYEPVLRSASYEGLHSSMKPGASVEDELPSGNGCAIRSPEGAKNGGEGS